MIKWLTEWDNSDQSWCPTQLYREFEFKGDKWTLYCRWRHDDPWQFYVWKGEELISSTLTMFCRGMSEKDPIEEVNAFAEKKLQEYLYKKL